MTARELALAAWPEMAQILTDLRHFLEICWSERAKELALAPATPSEGMCGFSCYVLARVLEDELGGGWKVVGGIPVEPDGSPRSSGGIVDGAGHWHGHYWIVDENEEFAIDLTSDQFGYGAIEIGLADDVRYDANYGRGEVDDQMRHVRWRGDEWLARWRDQRPAMGAGV